MVEKHHARDSVPRREVDGIQATVPHPVAAAPQNIESGEVKRALYGNLSHPRRPSYFTDAPGLIPFPPSPLYQRRWSAISYLCVRSPHGDLHTSWRQR